MVYYYGSFPLHTSRLLLLNFRIPCLMFGTHVNLCIVNSISFFFSAIWIKKIVVKSTEVYQKYFVEVFKKELLVYFHGYLKNYFKELRILMKEISRNHWYLLINSALKMLFKFSPCFENWSGHKYTLSRTLWFIDFNVQRIFYYQ